MPSTPERSRSPLARSTSTWEGLIEHTIEELPIKSVMREDSNLKTGYICDITAFVMTLTNSSQQTVIFKLSNLGNELSRVATKLNMYEKEAFFYEQIAPILPQGVMAVPKGLGTIRHEGRLGILLEDLRCYPGSFGMDLNCNMQTLMRLVSDAFAMHNHYFYHNEEEIIKAMRPLVKVSGISYYQELVRERFDKFMAKTTPLMTERQVTICKHIAGKYAKIAETLSSFPLSFCHGDFKSANIFYKKVPSWNSSSLFSHVTPVVMDWQYIHLGKGVSDIAFLLVESLEFDEKVADTIANAYYLLHKEKRGGLYPYEEYKRDFCCSLAMFPFFVMVWFNSEDEDKLIDKTFPGRFMRNLLKYFDHYLTPSSFADL